MPWPASCWTLELPPSLRGPFLRGCCRPPRRPTARGSTAGAVVEVPDGSVHPVLGTCTVKLCIWPFQGKVRALALDLMTFECRLGDAWLRQRQDILNLREDYVTLRKGQGTCISRAYSPAAEQAQPPYMACINKAHTITNPERGFALGFIVLVQELAHLVAAAIYQQ